ncbi:hypothetical protein PtB15_1B650 [Puccinia triticina]|nr:hypothetical protein PtB15_1B650 [Puccinia triticina]
MPTNAASGSWCTINLIRPAADSTQRTTTPCEEYQRKTSTDPTTGAIQETVTIESQDASPFEISFHIKPTTYSSIHQAATNSNKPQSAKNNNLQSLAHDDYVIDVYLDGIGVGSTTIHKSDPFPDSIDKIVIGQSLCRLLQFAPVNLVDPDDHQNSDDNDNICEDKKVIMSLGTIQFDVTRCVAVLEQSRPFTNEDGIQTTNQMNFSERFKKACLATTAGLGQPQVNQLYPETEWRATNADPKPFLQFIFRYKPRAILESEGKITPTVQELPSGRIVAAPTDPSSSTTGHHPDAYPPALGGPASTLHAGLLSVLALATPPCKRPAPPDQPVLFASPQAVERRCSMDKPLGTNLPRLGLAQLDYHNALAILPTDLRLSTQLSHLAAAKLRPLLKPFGPHVQPSLTSTATPHSPQPNSSSSQKLQAHSRLHIQTTPGHSRDIPSASCPTRPESPRRRQSQRRAHQDHPADRSGRSPRSNTAPSPPWPNPRAA